MAITLFALFPDLEHLNALEESTPHNPLACSLPIQQIFSRGQYEPATCTVLKKQPWKQIHASNHDSAFLVTTPSPRCHQVLPHQNKRLLYPPGNSKTFKSSVRCSHHPQRSGNGRVKNWGQGPSTDFLFMSHLPLQRFKN